MTSTEVLPDGVTVAQLILVQFVLVQIQVRQPFFLPSQLILPLLNIFIGVLCYEIKPYLSATFLEL